MAHRVVPKAAVVTISLLGLVGATTISAAPRAFGALPDATSFSFTGAAQNYTVPPNVCSIKIVAAGAQGGSGSLASEVLGDDLPGGLGGVAVTEINVNPGEVVQVNVGGQGGNGAWTQSADEGGKGGWNGGAPGGAGGSAGGGGAGGGGGASDVRQGGTGLDARVIVGGGGGGSGAYSSVDTAPHATGGAGGDPAGGGGNGAPLDIDGYVTPAGGGGGGGGGARGVGTPSTPGARSGDGSVTITPLAECSSTTPSSSAPTTSAPTSIVPTTTVDVGDRNVAPSARAVDAQPTYTG
jgi:hypothetical protein